MAHVTAVAHAQMVPQIPLIRMASVHANVNVKTVKSTPRVQKVVSVPRTRALSANQGLSQSGLGANANARMNHVEFHRPVPRVAEAPNVSSRTVAASKDARAMACVQGQAEAAPLAADVTHNREVCFFSLKYVPYVCSRAYTKESITT